MSRNWLIMVVSACWMIQASAHFLFVLPPAGPNKVHPVILADSPKPDDQIKVDALRQSHALIGEEKITPSGSKTPGVWKEVTNPTADSVVMVGDYGIVNRGEGEVYRLMYQAVWMKASSRVAAPLAVSLIVENSTEGIRFVAKAGGKPLEGVDLFIYEPGAEKPRVVQTDKSGFSPVFSQQGLYAARLLWKDKTVGDFEGKRYKETHYYSSVVTTHGK